MSMNGAIAATHVMNSLSSNSQNHKILSHLIMRGNISQLEARKLYGVERLTSRIHELRKSLPIVPERKKDLTGKVYMRYHLQMA